MDTLSPQNAAQEVNFCASSQSGKTEIANNFVGYIIDQDPGPVMVIQPNVKPMAEAWSKDRLAPMLRDTPVLKNKVAASKGRDSNNTMLHKTFPGGHLTIGGSNSTAGLASRPIRYLIEDEVDRYEITKEGDADKLVKVRTRTFWNRKILRVSSPTRDNRGILVHVEQSDTEKHLQLPCLNCDKYQYPLLRHFQWENRQIKQAVYVCEHCDHRHPLTDEHRIKFKAKWVVIRQGEGKSVGFRMNQFGSSLASWIDTLQEFLDSKGDPAKLRVFLNTALAEPWREYNDDIEQIISRLIESREEYPADVPQQAVLLTAGVDIQTKIANPRLEVSVYGWGMGEESWLIDDYVLYGDPHSPEVWKDLDQALAQTYQHESGVEMSISGVLVDSGDGNITTKVYEWCKPRKGRHIYATKGRGGDGVPLFGEPKEQKPSGAMLYSVGVDEAKATIMSRIYGMFDAKTPTEPGPGFIHFPYSNAMADKEFFAQLTGEYADTQKDKIIWTKRRARQEKFDTAVYAYVMMRIRLRQLRSFERITRLLLGESAAALSTKNRRRGRHARGAAMQV